MGKDEYLYSGTIEPTDNIWICGKCGEANEMDRDFLDAVEGYCEFCEAKNTL